MAVSPIQDCVESNKKEIMFNYKKAELIVIYKRKKLDVS